MYFSSLGRLAFLNLMLAFVPYLKEQSILEVLGWHWTVGKQSPDLLSFSLPPSGLRPRN